MAELEDGKPCTHKGCLSHTSHPCEVCGRISGMNITSDCSCSTPLIYSALSTVCLRCGQRVWENCIYAFWAVVYYGC